jgi:hypothetical protein
LDTRAGATAAADRGCALGRTEASGETSGEAGAESVGRSVGDARLWPASPAEGSMLGRERTTGLAWLRVWEKSGVSRTARSIWAVIKSSILQASGLQLGPEGKKGEGKGLSDEGAVQRNRITS